MRFSTWAIRMWCRWMGESKLGGMQAIRWSVDGTSESPRPHPWCGTNVGARSRRLLAVDSIEFLDDLVGNINGVLIVDHNLDCLFATLVDDQSKPGFLRHGFCG